MVKRVRLWNLRLAVTSSPVGEQCLLWWLIRQLKTLKGLIHVLLLLPVRILILILLLREKLLLLLLLRMCLLLKRVRLSLR